VKHPEAPRIRRESAAFARDLRLGFETARRYAPLVPLRDGRWIPPYPSRPYCGGRDFGWIREVLEGSVHLLLSGLYRSGSKQGQWILDDYLDNLHHTPPYGHVLRDQDELLRSRGGFSVQPCLLARLLPHLERDEPEIYIWMFFNAFCACYREEIDGFSEHPLPELGFSNPAQFKTSDEANAVMSLRCMFLWWSHDLLHFGRALPREWLGGRGKLGMTKVSTYFGVVDLAYIPDGKNDSIRLEPKLGFRTAPPKVLARFRHPDKKATEKVTVNGKAWRRFSRSSNDVDITGPDGDVSVVASF